MSTIEQQIQAKGLAAPRVKPADIAAAIQHTEFVKHVSKSGQVLRWAVLTMKNGYAAVGRPSVSVSPENDDPDIGERVAYENTVSELWPLMGYALKERLSTNSITERELAFAINAHSYENYKNEPDFVIAKQFVETVQANRGHHPSLGGCEPLEQHTENADHPQD